jgi:putative addiction module killer protein
MDASPRRIEIYSAESGKEPFTAWIEALKDKSARAAIRVRLDRVEDGNFGDHRSVGDGVSELRIAIGPGYRVYYGQDGKAIVLLLCAGDKAGQEKDIKKAKRFWQDYLNRG